jgi:ribonuclease E
VTPFELPLNELQRIAEGAGLEWINSDAQRVAQVQAAIAATPAVPRTPREPNRMVLPDEGPLVLVETRRDLKDMALPFDTTTSA